MNKQNLENVLEKLHPRKEEVLKLLLEGKTDDEIARKIQIETSTVRKHISQLYEIFEIQEHKRPMLHAFLKENQDVFLGVFSGNLDVHIFKQFSYVLKKVELSNKYALLQALKNAITVEEKVKILLNCINRL